MKKMRVLLLTLLLVFTASLTLACGVPFERTYNVTFATEEGNTLATLELKEGSKIDSDLIPQAPTATEDTYAFDGWYSGETKLDAEYVVTGHVTFKAKYVKSVYLLTFTHDGSAVATVRLSVGSAVEEGDLPTPPQAELGYKFTGWFNGEQQLRVGDVPTQDGTYETKYEKNAYKVTLVYGSDEYAAYVLYDGNGKVANGDLPQLNLPQGSVLLGWYNGNGKKLNSETINADCTYYAQVVKAEDYQGAWYSDEEKAAFVVGADGKAYVSSENKTYEWTFNDDGTLKIVVNTIPYDNYTFTLVNGKMQATHAYYDLDYEEDATDNYTLTKSSGLTGVYETHGTNNIEFVNGVVKAYKGNVYYGRVIATEDGYTARVYNSSTSSTATEYAFTVDAKGNVVADNGYIYVLGKKVKPYSNNIDETWHYLIAYEVNGEALYVYRDANGDSYVTINGEAGEGKIVTIVEKNLQVKLSGGNFLLKAEEAGTYTGADGALTLDGFGNATLGEQTYEYTINGKEVTVNGKVYVLNAEDSSYTVKEYIGYEGKYAYKKGTNDTYYVELDGYGTFSAWYNKGSKTLGTYTVGETALTVTGTGRYSYDGTFNLFENGNVLVYSSVNSKNGYTYIKEGAEIASKLDLFFKVSEGVYVNGEETLTLKQDTKTVEYLEGSYSFTGNYNYSELYFKAKYAKDKFGNNCDFTLKLDDDNNLVLSVKYCKDYDDVYEEYVYETDTVVYQPYKEVNYFLGEYKNTKDNYRIKVTETQFMFGTYENGEVNNWHSSDYTLENNVLKAYCYFENWTLTLVEGKTGYINVTSDSTYVTAVEFAEVSITLYDKMYGEYEARLVEGGNAQSVTFNFNGLLHEGNPLVKISYKGTTAEFRYNFTSQINLNEQGNKTAYCGILGVSTLIPNVNRYLLVLNEDGSLTAYASDATAATTGNANNLTLYKKGNLPTLPDTYEAGTAEELKSALKKALNGNTVKLTANVVIAETLVIDKNIVLDLNGKTISNTVDIWNAETKAWSLVTVTNGAKVTLNGNGKLIAKENDCYGIDVRNGAELTINSGYINGNLNAVYVRCGTLTVNGGKFEIQQTYSSDPYGFLLNCYDDEYAEGKAKIIVYGGEFVKFNPADCSAEGAHTNFVAEGYAATLGEDGTTYTVGEKVEPLDEIAGTWSFGDWTLTFDGKGSLTANNGNSQGNVTYVYDANTKALTFSFMGYDFEGEYDGTYLTISDEYEELLCCRKFTKAA